ncbi:MAG TPA: hypothetical protein DCE41_03510, partial [Cytophagales bacterium]|nr:hypothetical protein [Cytophagales bacterium]
MSQALFDMNTEHTPAEKPPIVNCHSHIFTGEHVPPYFAKTFTSKLLYHLLSVTRLVRWARRWEDVIDPEIALKKLKKRRAKSPQKGRLKIKIIGLLVVLWLRKRRASFRENRTLRITGIIVVLGLLVSLTFAAIPCLLEWLNSVFPESLVVGYVLFIGKTWWIWVLLIWIISRRLRNVVKFILGRAQFVLTGVTGKNSRKLISRYLSILAFARYRSQRGILSKLANQYPSNSQFVVLSMDMEYMEAGKVKKQEKFGFYAQLQELKDIKESSKHKIRPFLFADPRRVKHQQEYFSWELHEGRVVLKDCVVKDYLETAQFSGIKIYPALGYYPFDENLLPLWVYAAEHQIPIMTHCISGPMFYRGKKKTEWNHHPVIEGATKDKDQENNTIYRPMALPQKKNHSFTVNFTHPLNYLCLLDKALLAKVVKNCSKRIQELFGFDPVEGTLSRDLSNLKICLAHFGGEEEWLKYLARDRQPRAQHLIQNRSRGLDFSAKQYQEHPSFLEQVWWQEDWYSIICSLILHFPNVYSDVSYLLSKPSIYPLLNETLDPDLNPRLRDRILFGTDFYVVRNHGADKDLLARLRHGLSEKDFDLIARKNPIHYL